MYKIYINETPLFLLNTAELGQLPEYEGETLKARYPGRPKFLLHYIDMLEKSQRFAAVCLFHSDLEELFTDFKSLHKTIRAAGGLVSNPAGEHLFIYRRDFWDLPKGKIKREEDKKAAAVREVQEETGLKTVELGKKITITYHTYRPKSGKRVLKKVHWYQMYSDQTALVPEESEDIEIAVWRKAEDILAEKAPIYQNILDVLALSRQ